MLSIRVDEGVDAIDRMADEWNALAERTNASTFSRPEWFIAWTDTFTPKRLTTISAWAGDRLVGVLPLTRIRTDARGLYLNLLAPVASGNTDYQSPIVDPVLASSALPMMLDAAFSVFGRGGAFWWPNFPVDDPTIEIFRSFLATRRINYLEERETAPRFRFPGDGYAAAEGAWRASHRIDVRRQRKRLAEQGPVTLWQPATVEDAEAVLSEYFRVYDEKWLAQGYPGKFHNPLTRQYHLSMVRRLWNRGVHFSTVRCGSTDISYHFGFLSGGWLLWYRPTYRSEFGNFSPGKIHVSLLIEEGYRVGWKGLDFLLGAEPYKYMWSNESAEVASFHAGFHTWSPGYLWFCKGKPFVRSKLQLTYLRMMAWIQQRRRSGERKPS
jgi:CelD/BcsL family acetyltransferase involved in cellulose biosynthesis